MPRLLFEKKGNSVWISHLDTMRLFQRVFKRAGLPLTHTHGFNPRPSVSIALPLSVGVESDCELLDFDLDGDPVDNETICKLLNEYLVDGIRVKAVYTEEARKIKYLAYLDCTVDLEYDGGIPAGCEEALTELFSREEVLVPKKTKTNGIQDQNITPMIKSLSMAPADAHTLCLTARICCQNPTLNPNQMVAAIEKYRPDMKPDFSRCARHELYDQEEKIFR